MTRKLLSEETSIGYVGGSTGDCDKQHGGSGFGVRIKEKEFWSFVKPRICEGG